MRTRRMPTGQQARRATFAITLIIVCSAVLAVACGSGGNKVRDVATPGPTPATPVLTLQEYFHQVEDLYSRAQAESAMRFETHADLTLVENLKDNDRASEFTWETYVASVESLNPPLDHEFHQEDPLTGATSTISLREAHSELLAALKGLLDVYKQITNDTEAVTTVDEFTGVVDRLIHNDDFRAKEDRLEEACKVLQDLAFTERIDFDPPCGYA